MHLMFVILKLNLRKMSAHHENHALISVKYRAQSARSKRGSYSLIIHSTKNIKSPIPEFLEYTLQYLREIYR